AILLSSHLMAELQKSCDYLYVIEHGAIVNSGMTDDLIKRSVTLFTISAKGISKAESIKPFLISIRGQEATVQCKQGEISNLLKTLIYEGFEIISCVPNITLDELLKRTS
ncbi:MAG: ABC transporter ATP-binding protein, partial [Leeuwenhoekiella sp.]